MTPLKWFLESPESIAEAVMQLLQCSMVDFVIYQAEFKAAWWDPVLLEDPSVGLFVDSFPH